ncbi:MAG: hypothetical protein HC869_16720 [Rhodospirillales bacterium]|nr:hypothetical protein [Rhodospirillales bacterium]
MQLLGATQARGCQNGLGHSSHVIAETTAPHKSAQTRHATKENDRLHESLLQNYQRRSKHTRNKPTTETEFKALAYAMADAGSFKDARQIFHALSIWPVETNQWWNEDLAAQLDKRCRSKR